MKVIYLNCGQRWEYGNDLRSNEVTNIEATKELSCLKH